MRTGRDSLGPRRPSTIRDVAALAGVSKSTASRVLLGQSGVSPQNQQKVRRAIDELDFIPNQIARSLSVHSPAILGLFLRNSASPFYAHLAEAFENQAQARGYEVLSVASGDQPNEANFRSLMVLAGLRTAGIVVAAPIVDPHTIRQVASRVPVVLVGQLGQVANPHVPYVAPDPSQGNTLIDHLAALGHSSIALTAYPPKRSPTQWARISKMRDHAKALGLRNRVVVLTPETNMTDVVSKLHLSGTSAILCNNDWTALDAIASATRMALSVPGDLSITGHDGIPPFDHEALGLTTYRVPIRNMAKAAVELADRLIRDTEVDANGILLSGELVEGRTTGPPAKN